MKHVLVIVLSIGAVELPAFAEDTVPYAVPAAISGRELRAWAGQYHGSNPMAAYQTRLCG